MATTLAAATARRDALAADIAATEAAGGIVPLNDFLRLEAAGVAVTVALFAVLTSETVAA